MILIFLKNNHLFVFQTSGSALALVLVGRLPFLLEEDRGSSTTSHRQHAVHRVLPFRDGQQLRAFEAILRSGVAARLRPAIAPEEAHLKGSFSEFLQISYITDIIKKQHIITNVFNMELI